MKLLKIERPVTKNLKVARILFMVMTVLFAVYMCPMCYDDCLMSFNKVQIMADGNYEFVWSGMGTFEGIVHLVSLIYYTAATVAILILCLRTSLVANCIAWGLGLFGALLALLINTGLAEFMVYRYGILSFLYDRTDPWADWFVWIKPTFVLLMLAIATYYFIARLQERKIAGSNAQSAVKE